MRWIEHVQDRLSITRQEGLALLVLSGLYLGGLAARQYTREQQQLAAVATLQIAREGTAPGAASPSRMDDSLHSFDVKPVRVNLNTATAAELERLPRIGPKLAERIVAYRAAHGTFRRTRDLTRVSGIGEKTLARLDSLVYVGEGR